MAGWYKQHTSELATLETFARCGRADLIIAWCRLTRWTVDHESDEVPEDMVDARHALAEAGLLTTFAERCAGLMRHRDATAKWRSKTKQESESVISRDITRAHVTSRDNQDKTRQDETREDKISPRKRPAVRIPDAWTPTAAHRAAAESRGLAVEWQAERFRDHAQAHDRRCADWDAAFRNWLAKADPTRQPVTAARTQRPTLEAVGIPRFAPKALP